ncbi:MAG: hypothetical protein HOC21_07695 [Phycisphaerae bacterium]|jgi:hypothetical protein|nr:hypothetical protein [Phycisphaerae bacterium]
MMPLLIQAERISAIQMEKITSVSVCRNCVEDKIDISDPSTKGKMIQGILAGGVRGYDLHSESDCKIEKGKPDHPDHPGN